MSPDWGPKSPLQHPRGEEGGIVPVRGMPKQVEGSNMTLLTNTSSSMIEEMKDPALAQLEPLKEDLEDENHSNSEDEGLNMKEIKLEVKLEAEKK